MNDSPGGDASRLDVNVHEHGAHVGRAIAACATSAVRAARPRYFGVSHLLAVKAPFALVSLSSCDRVPLTCVSPTVSSS